MLKLSSPHDFFRLHADACQMLIEAHTVASLRFLGMCGLRPLARNESSRMISEKVPAFSEAAGAALRVAAGGGDALKAAEAWLRPIRAQTRENARRLRAPSS